MVDISAVLDVKVIMGPLKVKEDQTPTRSMGYEPRDPFSHAQSYQDGVEVRFALSVGLVKHVETAWLINKGDGADP